jgi:hypothetical protein
MRTDLEGTSRTVAAAARSSGMASPASNRPGAPFAAPTKRIARIAGLLYLVLAIGTALAHAVITTAYVPGQAATTAANVLASPGQFRLGIAADLVGATAWIFFALAVAALLESVSRQSARALVVFSAIGAAMMLVSDAFALQGLRVAADGSYATAVGAPGSNALVLLLLDLHHTGTVVAMIFMGLWLVPLGHLAYASRLFPRPLGALLVVGGASYLVRVVASIVGPDIAAQFDGVTTVATIGEIWMLGYLLVIGIRSPKGTVRVSR